MWMTHDTGYFNDCSRHLQQVSERCSLCICMHNLPVAPLADCMCTSSRNKAIVLSQRLLVWYYTILECDA